MRYILKNISHSLRHSRMICLLYVLCSAAAVLAVLFSHGVYQNYSTETYIQNTAKNQNHAGYSFGTITDKLDYYGTVSYLADGSATVGELRQVLGLLDEDIKESFTGFFFDYATGQYGLEEWMSGRLEYHPEEHRYGLYGAYLENIRVSYGRYITDEEEYSGARVAVVRAYDINDIPPPKVEVGGSIELFGQEYEVIGAWNEADAGADDLAVPFASLPDDFLVRYVSFLTDQPVPTRAFNAVNTAMEQVFGDRVNIPIMETVDEGETRFYTSIVLISVVLSAIAAITLMILFRYIVFTRRRMISILRLAGCTRGRAAAMFILEAAGVSAVIFLLCGGLYHFLLLPRLTFFFPSITRVYTAGTYLYIFGVFMGVLLLTVTAMVLAVLDRQPVEMLRRAGR